MLSKDELQLLNTKLSKVLYNREYCFLEHIPLVNGKYYIYSMISSPEDSLKEILNKYNNYVTSKGYLIERSTKSKVSEIEDGNNLILKLVEENKEYILKHSNKYNMLSASYLPKIRRTVLSIGVVEILDGIVCDNCGLRFLDDSDIAWHIKRGVCMSAMSIVDSHRKGYQEIEAPLDIILANIPKIALPINQVKLFVPDYVAQAVSDWLENGYGGLSLPDYLNRMFKEKQ